MMKFSVRWLGIIGGILITLTEIAVIFYAYSKYPSYALFNLFLGGLIILTAVFGMLGTALATRLPLVAGLILLAIGGIALLFLIPNTFSVAQGQSSSGDSGQKLYLENLGLSSGYALLFVAGLLTMLRLGLRKSLTR